MSKPRKRTKSVLEKLEDDVLRLTQERELLFALRWTASASIDPDVPPPANGARTRGYLFNVYNASVAEYWSEGHRHSRADNPGAATQGGVALFSTKLLALRALRYVLERSAAKTLFDVDKQIARIEQEGGDDESGA